MSTSRDCQDHLGNLRCSFLHHPWLSYFSVWEWAEKSVFLTCFPMNLKQLSHHWVTHCLESHNNREIMFSYLDTISPFLFVFTPCFSPVFSVKWFCCAPSLRYGEGAKRWFFVWEIRSLLESQALFRQWPPKPSSLSEPSCFVNVDSVPNCFQLIFLNTQLSC